MIEPRTFIWRNEKGEFVKVTKDVLERLHENSQSPSPQSAPQPQVIPNEKYEAKIRDLQGQNELLWKAANGKLLNTLNELEKQHFQLKHRDCCPKLKKAVQDCYLENKNQTLNCDKVVKEFIACTNEFRKNLLN